MSKKNMDSDRDRDDRGIALAFFDWNWLRAPLASSLALGALNPLAASLPLIDTGGNKDADCRGLMQEAKENVQACSTAPARGATPRAVVQALALRTTTSVGGDNGVG